MKNLKFNPSKTNEILEYVSNGNTYLSDLLIGFPVLPMYIFLWITGCCCPSKEKRNENYDFSDNKSLHESAIMLREVVNGMKD